MQIEILSEAKVICSNKNSFQNYFAWSTVARLPGGELAMVCSGFRVKHLCPFGKVAICYSRDEGKTWSYPAPVIDTPLDDRDGGIAVSGNQVIVTSFNNTLAMQNQFNEEQYTYTDPYVHSAGGSSFYVNKVDTLYNLVKAYIENVNTKEAEERFLGSVYTISKDGGYTFGEIKKIPVTAPHGPIPCSDGGFLYVGAKFNKEEGSNSNIACYKMEDNDEFVFVGEIKNIDSIDGMDILLCEPHAIVLPNGNIIVHLRVQSADMTSHEYPLFSTYQSESYDGGKTFTKPHPIFEDRRIGAPSHLMLHSSGVLIATLGVRCNPYGIRVIISRDMGQSWEDMGLIYNNQNISEDIGYPSSVELSDGSILTAFYAHEKENSPSEIMQVIWKLH